MHFSLKNDPETFQRAFSYAVTSKIAVLSVNFDDIVVPSHSPRDQIHYVKQVLSFFQGAGDALKLKTCNFLTGSVDYFGHVI